MIALTKGANAVLTSTAVEVSLSWAQPSGAPLVDLSALVCGEGDRVASDDDFVFYNQRDHPTGSVRHIGQGPTTGSTLNDRVEIHTSRIPPNVHTVVLVASAETKLGDVPELTITIADLETGEPLMRFGIVMTVEHAVVAGELYKRDSGWKFRAVGQGYADGLAGLARDYGISVESGNPPGTGTSPAPPSEGVDWLNPPVPAGYEI